VIRRFRLWLVARITDIYTYEEFVGLPGWCMDLVDRLDPTSPRRDELLRFIGFDPAATTKRVVFEDGEWWCYTEPVPDLMTLHNQVMQRILDGVGIPKWMLGNSQGRTTSPPEHEEAVARFAFQVVLTSPLFDLPQSVIIDAEARFVARLRKDAEKKADIKRIILKSLESDHNNPGSPHTL